MEQGNCGQFIGALNAGRDMWHVLREGEGDNGDGTVSEEVSDKGTVGWGGEDGDGETPLEKEASKVEDWDGMAFGHEGKENHMARFCTGRFGTHDFLLLQAYKSLSLVS